MDPFSNARIGIQLAQQGRREDALSYLRIAVQSEPPHPEVWLWLAHVSPIREEYQHCIQQALSLAPNHATARQMFAMLRTSTGSMPALQAPPSSGTGPSQSIAVDEQLIRSMRRQKQRRSQRRLLFFVFTLVLIFGIAAVVGLLFQDDLSDSNNSDNEALSPNLSITVSPTNTDREDNFALLAPDSWILADVNNPTWQTAKAQLENDTRLTVDWSMLETNTSAITVSPESNTLSPLLRIVETDAESIIASSGFPLRLELVRLSPREPLLNEGGDCAAMRRFAEEQRNSLQDAESVLSNQIIDQGDDHCIFYIHYRGRSALSEQIEHIFVIYVPIAPQGIAEWHLTVSDRGLEFYQAAIEDLLGSITDL